MTGQQQTSSTESEFDFPQDDSAFAEFKDEGVDFTVAHQGMSEDIAAAGASHVSGKQSLFDGYKDPSKQFSGHTRSYHQDIRYKYSLSQLQSTVNMFLEDKGNDFFFGCVRHFYSHGLNRHVWGQLYRQHQLRSYHQDPSTVGGLTAEDIEKARQGKKVEIKSHKQMVIIVHPFLILNTHRY